MNTDRRSHIRVNLRLQLFLAASGASMPIRTETENVSMDGFFFHSEQLFPPGECLHFLLVLPGAAAGTMHSARVMCLKGAVEVVRVTASTAGPGFGIACRMSNYSVLLNPNVSTEEQILAALTKEGGAGSPRANSPLKYLIPLH
jgi:hypothetical protein